MLLIKLILVKVPLRVLYDKIQHEGWGQVANTARGVGPSGKYSMRRKSAKFRAHFYMFAIFVMSVQGIHLLHNQKTFVHLMFTGLAIHKLFSSELLLIYGNIEHRKSSQKVFLL